MKKRKPIHYIAIFVGIIITLSGIFNFGGISGMFWKTFWILYGTLLIAMGILIEK